MEIILGDFNSGFENLALGLGIGIRIEDCVWGLELKLGIGIEDGIDDIGDRELGILN